MDPITTALTKAEELITHYLGCGPEVTETLEAIKEARVPIPSPEVALEDLVNRFITYSNGAAAHRSNCARVTYVPDQKCSCGADELADAIFVARRSLASARGETP